MNPRIKKDRGEIYFTASKMESKKIDSAKEYLSTFNDKYTWTCMAPPLSELELFNDRTDIDWMRRNKQLIKNMRILCLLLCREMTK